MTYSTWKTTKIRSSVPLSLQSRNVNVQDAPTIMTDDEEAVEHAERNRWRSEEIHGRNRFPMVSKESQPALGPVRISRCSLHPTGDGFPEGPVRPHGS